MNVEGRNVAPRYLRLCGKLTGAYERMLTLLGLGWFAAVSDLLRRQGRVGA